MYGVPTLNRNFFAEICAVTTFTRPIKSIVCQLEQLRNLVTITLINEDRGQCLEGLVNMPGSLSVDEKTKHYTIQMLGSPADAFSQRRPAFEIVLSNTTYKESVPHKTGKTKAGQLVYAVNVVHGNIQRVLRTADELILSSALRLKQCKSIVSILNP